jgi:hypothetical protein
MDGGGAQLAQRRILAACFLSFLILLPGAAGAQDTPLSRVLFDLVLESVIMRSTTATVAGNPHDAHYIPGFTQEETPAKLNQALVSQLSTFPIGSSSGGFAYSIDSTTGAIRPASSSFGPSFAERPLTIGRGRYNAGFNYQRARYTSFDGVDLEDGSISFMLRHNNCCPPTNNNPTETTDLAPFFEGDLVQTDLSVDLRTDTATFFANYGVTNSLDLGIVVPIVRVDLQASSRSTIVRLSTGEPGPSDPDPQNIHSWDGLGATVLNLPNRGGSASGLGDLLVRAKYAFLNREAGGAAVGFDLRLPTGDEADLLGTGGTQARLQFIGSAAVGNFSPHVNFGYTFSRGELTAPEIRLPTIPGSAAIGDLGAGGVSLPVPDELNYTFGFDLAAAPRVTVGFDVVGRTLRDMFRFDTADSSFPYLRRNETQERTATFTEFSLVEQGRLTLLLGAVGAKVNVGRTLLLTGALLFPMTDNGLRPKVTPVVGFDYAF